MNYCTHCPSPASQSCANCKRPLCADCIYPIGGKVYCDAECAPVTKASTAGDLEPAVLALSPLDAYTAAVARLARADDRVRELDLAFMDGKSELTDLRAAILERDQADRACTDLWQAHPEIRAATLGAAIKRAASEQLEEGSAA